MSSQSPIESQEIEQIQNFEDIWLTHAWDGFPREVWNGDQRSKWKLIKSKGEYLEFLHAQRNNFAPAHTSVNIGTIDGIFGYKWIGKILIELDAPGRDLYQAYTEMRRLYAHLRLKFGAEPRIYFSGNRSFHIFIDLGFLPLSEPVEAQREFARRLSKDLNLKYLDFQVFSARKLSRVPLTLHEDTISYCVPISPFWRINEIKDESAKPRRLQHLEVALCTEIAAELSKIDKTFQSEPRIKRSRVKGPKAYTWIEELLSKPVPDGRHRLLWHVFAPYLVNIKKLDFRSAEALLAEYFNKCAFLCPLSPSRTAFMHQIRYYIKLAQRDGYGPWRLQTIEKNDPELFRIIMEAKS